MISCIVPVYNNEGTIGHVVSTLLKVREIDELIVINDGSVDNTTRVLNQFSDKLILLENITNEGKGSAFVKGYNKSRGDIILMCDADFSKLKIEHIHNMIAEFNEGNELVISAIESKFKLLGKHMDWLSGLRIYRKDSIEMYIDFMADAGYGIEQIINHAHKNKKIKFILAKDIGHILKYERPNTFEWLTEYGVAFKNIIEAFAVLSYLDGVSYVQLKIPAYLRRGFK